MRFKKFFYKSQDILVETRSISTFILIDKRKIFLVESEHGFKTIISKKENKFYDVITGLIDGKEYHCPDFEITSCYDKSGQYLGDAKMVEQLIDKYKIEQFEKTKSTNSICTIGYSPTEGKWYGWSHRAIFGFKEGSTCKEGDCHFQPSNKKEFLESLKQWHVKEDTKFVFNKQGIRVSEPNSRLSIFEKYPEKWGRGCWTAKNMNDAKQMAIDFAAGVS